MEVLEGIPWAFVFIVLVTALAIGWRYLTVDCPDCGGTKMFHYKDDGLIKSKRCALCNGAGRIWRF